jgi:hypothetical protein
MYIVLKVAGNVYAQFLGSTKILKEDNNPKVAKGRAPRDHKIVQQ